MSILSKDYITINGVKSDELGLYVDTPPMPSMSVPMFQDIQIPGRGESVVMKKTLREDVEILISAYLFDDSAYNPNELYAYLQNAETLITSKSDEYQYRVKRLNQLVPTYQGHGKQFLSISFICSPYRYSTSNTAIATSSKEFWIEAEGTIHAEPIYKLYGNGDLKLKVNNDADNELTIFSVSGYCVVDTERMIIHKDGQFLKSRGLLPYLNIGSNIVNISNNVSKIEITKNERWI